LIFQLATSTPCRLTNQIQQQLPVNTRNSYGSFFQVQPGEIPSLDLILLGMGMMGTPPLCFLTPMPASDHLVTVGNKDGQSRLTFTIPLINLARCVMFIVAGASKQSALEQIFAPAADDLSYPASVNPTPRGTFVLLDQSAAQT
jgi:6-phosphogluconolactonase